MTLFTFIVSGVIAGAFGILGALICLPTLRNHRATHAELRSMLREHKVECSGQIEQLRRSIAGLELQPPRPGMSPDGAVSRPAIGRREMQLIARISTVLVHPRGQAPR